MKILIQSILFIIVVALFAVTSDRLSKIESSNMNSEEKSESQMSDEDFLTDVIIHHNGAIAMAKDALEKSERPEILQFAIDVIVMETTNVEQAYIWRRDWYGNGSHIFMDKASAEVSMIRDLGAKDDGFDLRFLDAMIAHHEGAIAMLEDILVPTTKTEIHSMALSGIIGLGKDVEKMKQWKDAWYGK